MDASCTYNKNRRTSRGGTFRPLVLGLPSPSLRPSSPLPASQPWSARRMRKTLSQPTGPSSQLCLSPPRAPERRPRSSASARPGSGDVEWEPHPFAPAIPQDPTLRPFLTYRATGGTSVVNCDGRSRRVLPVLFQSLRIITNLRSNIRGTSRTTRAFSFYELSRGRFPLRMRLPASVTCRGPPWEM